MKKKFLTTLILAIIIIFSIQLSAKAVVISTDKKVESGSGTVTISITSKQLLGAYTLKLIDTAGLTLVSTSSDGEISLDNKTITGSNAKGTTELGKFTFSVPSVTTDTKYNIKFTITGMETPDLDPIPDETNTAELTVEALKVEPEPETETGSEPEQTPTPTPVQEPNFTTTNKKMYAKDNMNLRESWSTESKETKIEKGTELTVTATSNNTVNKYVWYRVTYNGKTLYAASNLLTNTKPEEKSNDEPKDETPISTTNEETENNETTTVAKSGLQTLKIAGCELTPEFNSEIYEYRVILKEEISELDITAVPALDGETVTIGGNENLSEGENLIVIVVYNAKKEVKETYQITVNKNTIDLSNTNKWLEEGNKEARKSLLIFVLLLSISTIVLIVIIIVRHRNSRYEECEDEYQDLETTELKTNIKDTNEFETEDTENLQNEIEEPRTKREKRKGKHF